MKPERVIHEVDVLVIGGGVSALFAALRAKQRNSDLKVLVVDKCCPGVSGASAYAAGVLPYWHPGDPYEEYAKEIIADVTDYLIDQDYVYEAIKGSFEVFKDYMEAGLRLQRDESGEPIRIPAIGSRYARCTPYYGGHELPWKIAVWNRRLGVQLLGRICMTDLLVDNNVCSGGVGFGVRDGKFYVFKSKATVLANGSLFYGRRPQMGPGGTTGDAQAMALRAGLSLRGLEQVWATHGPAMFDSSGVHVIFGHGGKLVNAKGERFIGRYSPQLLEKTRRYEVARAILSEWLEGRGPCYLDCTHLAPSDLSTIKQSLPRLTQDLSSRGLDLAKDKIEWVAYGLTFHETGGVRIMNSSGECGCRGLFAVGTAGDYCGGIEATAVAALPGASYTGTQGGAKASEHASQIAMQTPSEAQISDLQDRAFVPLASKRAATHMPARRATSRLSEIVHKNINLIKDEKMLLLAIKEIRELRQEFGHGNADDPHELMFVHGVANKMLLAEGTAKSALIRKESRACHYRRDFPDRDDNNWLKWVITTLNQREVTCTTEDIPIFKWKHRPNMIQKEEPCLQK